MDTPLHAPIRTTAVSSRLHEIDLLRIAAAVSVMAYHYLFSAYAGRLSPMHFPHADLIARYGYLGVDLFFTISGFVVLLSAWDRTPRSFAVSRAVRLYPAYWIAVTLTTIVSVFLWAWLAATAVFETGLLPRATDLVLNTQFSHYFIAGMALCLIRRYGATPQPLIIVALALANAIYRGIGFADRVGVRYGTEIHRPVVIAVIVAIFAIMLAIALKLTTRVARPWFAIAGALTYPLYLIHAHIGFIIFERLGDQVNHVLLVAATMSTMLAAAAALHYWVERPLAPRLSHALRK